jgi:hypothetical protein
MLESGKTRAAVCRHFAVNRIVIERVWSELHGRKKTGLLPVLKNFM